MHDGKPHIAERTAVVAHDAGAGQHILSWLRTGSLDAAACNCAFEGPTLAAAARQLPTLPVMSLEEALADASLLISGTGWASTFEHEARAMAKARGIRVAAVIDLWAN